MKKNKHLILNYTQTLNERLRTVSVYQVAKELNMTPRSIARMIEQERRIFLSSNGQQWSCYEVKKLPRGKTKRWRK